MLDSRGSLQKSFKTASEKAGLKNLRFHDLRRVFATYLHESGVSLRVIQEMLGHSSLMMTQIYLSSSLGAMTEAAEKLHFFGVKVSKRLDISEKYV